MYQQIGGDSQSAAQAVVETALSRGLWIASAESCTGGLIAFMLTSIAGVSAIYRGGVVAYANDAKRDLLQVDQALLDRYGAVSEHVAEAMVRGACAAFRTDYAVSTTGIAGPGGATETKPVGLVYCAAGSPTQVRCRDFRFGGTRAEIMMQATVEALALLQQVLSTDPRRASARI